MNLIAQTFNELKKKNQTAFIPFITVGECDLQTTIEILRELQNAGASIIELGVPYSDPLADGPVIQRAAKRALEHGTTIFDVFNVAKEARKAGIRVPFILFTYYNPLLRIGFDTAFSLMKKSGINGVIVPDLPVEESEPICSFCATYQIGFIPLVAPTSKSRIEQIVKQATGFIYCVSSLGVTGVRQEFHKGIEELISSIRNSTDLPIAVGFGISNRKQFQKISELCDGGVVGSAIVQVIEDNLQLLTEVDNRSLGLKEIYDFANDFLD